jgi:hypothetical protein
MAKECKMLRLCGFLKKHYRPDNIPCLWFRKEYCTGSKEDECERKKYMIAQGKVPPDDMAPNGETVPSDRPS